MNAKELLVAFQKYFYNDPVFGKTDLKQEFSAHAFPGIKTPKFTTEETRASLE
jgi:hypothetical protein